MSHGVTCQFNFPASAVRAIDPHPADCQCADCFALKARAARTLTPDHSTHPTVSDGEQPVGSADTSVSKAGCSKISRPGEAEVISAARKVVVKEILKLVGKDVPSPRLHAKYLESISFTDLCARRDQLKNEAQLDLFTPKRERLQIQPEVFDRRNVRSASPKHDRSQKYFEARRNR